MVLWVEHPVAKRQRPTVPRLSVRGDELVGYLLDASGATIATVHGQTHYGRGDTYTGAVVGWGAGLPGLASGTVVVGDDFVLGRATQADSASPSSPATVPCWPTQRRTPPRLIITQAGQK